jgi:CxxC motif-containing protein (DUF1111 family)
MRFLAAPAPSCTPNFNCSSSINDGFNQFQQIGCSTCHKPSMTTGPHPVAALSQKQANLYSDLLVHNMGQLGDGITQGVAGPSAFRTAPLWGIGQRIFFLHDGRTSDLLDAIEDHANGGQDTSSEADQVIANFNHLTSTQQQDLLNFLRSL